MVPLGQLLDMHVQSLYVCMTYHWGVGLETSCPSSHTLDTYSLANTVECHLQLEVQVTPGAYRWGWCKLIVAEERKSISDRLKPNWKHCRKTLLVHVKLLPASVRLNRTYKEALQTDRISSISTLERTDVNTCYMPWLCNRMLSTKRSQWAPHSQKTHSRFPGIAKQVSDQTCLFMAAGAA